MRYCPFCQRIYSNPEHNKRCECCNVSTLPLRRDFMDDFDLRRNVKKYDKNQKNKH